MCLLVKAIWRQSVASRQRIQVERREERGRGGLAVKSWVDIVDYGVLGGPSAVFYCTYLGTLIY